jgi:hypothetical protein
MSHYWKKQKKSDHFSFKPAPVQEQDTLPHTNFGLNNSELGYHFHKQDIETKLVIGVSFNQKRYEHYIKNAYLKWNNIFPYVSALIGVRDNYQYQYQENFWQMNYVIKSILNEKNLSASADIGTTIFFKWNVITLNSSVTHGEGYKNIHCHAFMKYSGGLYLEDIYNFHVYMYGEYYPGLNNNAQEIVGGFIGYTKNFLKTSIDIYYIENYNFERELDYFIYTLQIAFNVRDKGIYIKYDDFYYQKEKYLTIGLEQKIFENFKISPHFKFSAKNCISSVNLEYRY